MTRIFGIVAAVLFHAALILFGGLLFWKQEPEKHYQNFELLSDAQTKVEEQKDKAKDKEKPAETEKKSDDVQAQDEKPPDAQEIVRSIEASAAVAAPALEAASLGQLEQALNGVGGGGGDFGTALTLEGGGVIGGTGRRAATLDEKFEGAFSLSEIDQKPRALFQAAPTYPAEMRSRKIEGVVQVLFVVDQQGKVINTRAEQSTHEAFVKPALEAIRRWKFEPAIKGGQKVQCKMRVPIRFQPS